MWCAILLLFILVIQAACSPFFKDKSVVLFTCPADGTCYASPRNCFDNCNAAFSMRSNGNGWTTFNITMMSPLSYTAVLIKEQEDEKFNTAVICSFYTPKGIVATVDFPQPIFVLELIDATEPEGRMDSTHTQCSTSIFNPPPPTGSKFKLISGKWQSALVIDEDLAVEVVPAVENARILSTNEKLVIPSPKVPAFRASEPEDVFGMPMTMISESFAQRQQFENKVKNELKNIERSMKESHQADSTENDSQETISTSMHVSNKISEENVSEEEEDVMMEDMKKREEMKQNSGQADGIRENNHQSSEISAEGSETVHGEQPRFRTVETDDHDDEMIESVDDDEDSSNFSTLTCVLIALSSFTYLHVI